MTENLCQRKHWLSLVRGSFDSVASRLNRHKTSLQYLYIKSAAYRPVQTSGKDNVEFPVPHSAWLLEPYNTTQGTGDKCWVLRARIFRFCSAGDTSWHRKKKMVRTFLLGMRIQATAAQVTVISGKDLTLLLGETMLFHAIFVPLQ